MDYATALDYVDSFVNFEKISRYDYASGFKLERMRAFLQELGNPHESLDVIHVAGSKGKGSTCAIAASILKEAGYSVGLYTSPHLIDTRERIRILSRRSWFPSASGGLRRTGVVRGSEEFEGSIAKEELISLVEIIKPVAEKFREHKELGRLSFFEILTACAFLYFKEKKVDASVLETGLGGRLDATNVAMPIACGITNISLEHTDKLGNSLRDIAREKAGIIKNSRSSGVVRSSVVSAPQVEEVRNVIKEICKEREAGLLEIGKDITYKIIKSGENDCVFCLKGPGYSYDDLRVNLIGAHQAENSALAIAILKCLDKVRFKIDEDSVRKGLENTCWPGRLQVVHKSPYVILDGAQNVASIRVALSSIKSIFKYNRLIVLFGISSDKDIGGVSRELDRVSDVVILTKSRSERAKEPLELKENFSKPEVKLSSNVKEGLGMALNLADKRDLVLVTGSLYVVGEAMKAVDMPTSLHPPRRV